MPQRSSLVNPITLSGHPSWRYATRAGALRETVGALSGISGFDPKSFICIFGQSGRSPRLTGSIQLELYLFIKFSRMKIF